MPTMIEPTKYTRKQLNAMAEKEGIELPEDRTRFPTRADVAQAIMEARAAVDPTGKEAEELAAFEPRVYWAVGPEHLTHAPRVKHPALGRGKSIKPHQGRYVATTPFEAELIETRLVKKGLAYPEDPPELWDALERCEACNFHARSVRAMGRHFIACHPMG